MSKASGGKPEVMAQKRKQGFRTPIYNEKVPNFFLALGRVVMIASSNIIEPRLLALDTSHLSKLVRDISSPNSEVRQGAKAFHEQLMRSGHTLLICWHHFDELLRHADASVVAKRIAFIRSLPLVAWIASLTPEKGLGSIVDIHAAEAAVAFELGDADAVGVRDGTRKRLIEYGPGEQAVGPYVDIWAELRPHLLREQEREREIVAIARSQTVDISKWNVRATFARPARTPQDAQRQFERLQKQLEAGIATRGDRRLPDPPAVAGKFIDAVKRDGASILSGDPDAALRYLMEQGIEPADIRPETTFEEIFELATFRWQLSVASRLLEIPWDRLKSAATPERLPSWVIQDALRKYGQSRPEHKGSELADRYLACLSAYADVVYVDRQTHQDFKRALHKLPKLKQLVHRVEKAANYSDIVQHL